MNLLAHAVLTPTERAVRVGNVLADFIRRNEIEGLAPDIRKGIDLHRSIDRFTDNHAVVEASKARLVAFQRFGNPLVDVIYDHFLVRHWEQEAPMLDYVRALYSEIEIHMPQLPDQCKHIATRMIDQDWMSQYGTFEGLATNLGRMSKRIEWSTGRQVDLGASLQILEVRYEEFERDFLEFWPELKAHMNVV